MREILFRGKRMDNGEWIEGYYFEFDCHSFITMCKDSFISHYFSRTSIFDLKMRAIQVKPSTICQYTGLTDKNGRKIFEGDIIRQKTTKKFHEVNGMEWEQYGIVRFGEYDWRESTLGYETVCFYVEHLKNKCIKPKNYCLGRISAGLNQSDILSEYYPYEVVGNIFDNPELMEGEQC